MVKQEKTDRLVLMTGIIGLVILEIFAMGFGINGTMRTIIFTLIALMVGINIPKEVLRAMIRR